MRDTPTTIQLKNRLASNIRNAFGFADDDNINSVDAFSAVLAAEFRTMYLYAVDNRRNQYPDTADLAEEGGELERLGRIYLNREPYKATEGIYKLTLTGTIGAVLRTSLTFKSSENSKSPGQLFILDEEHVMPGDSGEIIVRSLGLGLDFSLDLNDILTVTEPVLGLQQDSVVSEIIALPLAPEPIENFRKAINNAIQLEATGGSKADYRFWANDAQGCRYTFPYVKENEAGTIQVFVEANKVDSIDGKGTPSQPLMDEVEAVLNFNPDTTQITAYRGRRPMQANLEVLPITLLPIDVNITGLTNTTPAMLQAITDNLSSYLDDIRPFIAGGMLLRDKNDVLLSAKLSGVVSDVIGSANYFTNFIMLVDGNEVNFFNFALSNIPYFRNLNIL